MNNNVLAFTALAGSYCSLLENVSQLSAAEFVRKVVQLLPRMYIIADELQRERVDDFRDECFSVNSLDEEYYEAIRRNLESLLGPNDTYLEVFEEDMKYSDTPIGASLSEGLADIFQVMYNFVNQVRDASDQAVDEAVDALVDDFDSFWSQQLVNLMRPLNALRTADLDLDDNPNT